MPRAKIPRKSTSVDMTAMCDVAFLLLSFFILTTKFKPSEALEVSTPGSVANQVAPSSDVVLITIDNKGKVFFSMSDDAPKADLILKISQRRGLNLTQEELDNFNKAPFVGVPFSKLKSLLQKKPEEQAKITEGIPVDSTNNEMMDWMSACYTIFQGRKMNLLLKGDSNSKYPSFQAVIKAFKKNDFMKFQMVTNPESIPTGSELYNANMVRGKK